MNKLSAADRTKILHLLCEGNSIRAVTRLTGSSKNTVVKLLSDTGRVCAQYQGAVLRDLPCKRVQIDEIWSFTYYKQKNVETAKSVPAEAGDTWTWMAICADTKLIINWLVGGRDSEYAGAFIADLKDRLANRVQLTSDGHKAYLGAVEDAFGADVDYAQLVKLYGAAPENAKGRYSPAECTGILNAGIEGNPDPAHVSTSYAERQNLTMRMHMRRFRWQTTGFSKKVESHAYAVALHAMYYNFVRIHSKLRVTPAMAAGVTERLWDVSDIVSLIEASEAMAEPKRRGPYQKQSGVSAEHSN